MGVAPQFRMRAWCQHIVEVYIKWSACSPSLGGPSTVQYRAQGLQSTVFTLDLVNKNETVIY